MNLRSAKTIVDINLAGITAEFERQDGSINGLVLKDAAGNSLTIRSDRGYSLNVLVPEPPKPIVRWRLKGTVNGKPIEEVFDHEYQIDTRKRDLSLTSKDSTVEKFIVEE